MPDALGMGIRPNGSAIGVQPEQRECPRAWRAKALRGRQRFGEQGGGPPPPRRTSIAACTLAQRPKCPPMAILGAAIFKPASIEAHEVAKPPCVGIARMLDKGSQPGICISGGAWLP